MGLLNSIYASSALTNSKALPSILRGGMETSEFWIRLDCEDVIRALDSSKQHPDGCIVITQRSVGRSWSLGPLARPGFASPRTVSATIHITSPTYRLVDLA